jgi:hypothetical protein
MASATRGRDLTGFIVLIALILLAGVVLTSSNEQGPDVVSVETSENPSIENTRASGSRGLYEWTEKLGYNAVIWRRDFLSLPDDASVVFCIAPNLTVASTTAESPASPDDSGETQQNTNTLTAAEGAAIRQWISSGHTFILFASSLPASGPTAGDVEKTSTFGDELGINVESVLRNQARRVDFAPMQPSIWTDGIDSIRVHPGYRLYRPTGDGIVLFGGLIETPSRRGPRLESEPVAMVCPIGKGRLIAVADDVFACNANLVRADNAAFIYRMLVLSAKPGSKILFDEYHREFGGEPPSFWSAIGKPAQFAFMQFTLACIIAVFVLAPRLGMPRPLGDSKPRTSAEYVTSLAGLYQHAGASGAALDSVYKQFLREVCQRYGLPAGVTLDRMAETAARRGGVNAADLRKLLAACERALDSPTGPSERDLIALVRVIERFRKELGIG